MIITHRPVLNACSYIWLFCACYLYSSIEHAVYQNRQKYTSVVYINSVLLCRITYLFGRYCFNTVSNTRPNFVAIVISHFGSHVKEFSYTSAAVGLILYIGWELIALLLLHYPWYSELLTQSQYKLLGSNLSLTPCRFFSTGIKAHNDIIIIACTWILFHNSLVPKYIVQEMLSKHTLSSYLHCHVCTQSTTLLISFVKIKFNYSLCIVHV